MRQTIATVAVLLCAALPMSGAQARGGHGPRGVGVAAKTGTIRSGTAHAAMPRTLPVAHPTFGLPATFGLTPSMASVLGQREGAASQMAAPTQPATAAQTAVPANHISHSGTNLQAPSVATVSPQMLTAPQPAAATPTMTAPQSSAPAGSTATAAAAATASALAQWVDSTLQPVPLSPAPNLQATAPVFQTPDQLATANAIPNILTPPVSDPDASATTTFASSGTTLAACLAKWTSLSGVTLDQWRENCRHPSSSYTGTATNSTE